MITYELATDISLPNITVYRKYKDGVHIAYRLNTNDGYVMYDITANNTAFDEDGNEYPITYYFRLAYIPASVPVVNWPWVAVPEADVPADQIYGDVTEPPEIM